MAVQVKLIQEIDCEQSLLCSEIHRVESKQMSLRAQLVFLHRCYLQLAESYVLYYILVCVLPHEASSKRKTARSLLKNWSTARKLKDCLTQNLLCLFVYRIVLTSPLASTARSVWMVSMVMRLTEHPLTARNVHAKVHEPQRECALHANTRTPRK